VGASVWDTKGVIDELEKLVGDGLSANQIGRALTFKFNQKISRCAVIGKAARIGLKLPHSPFKRKRVERIERRAPPPRPAPANPLRRALEMAPEPMPFAIVEEVVVPEKERVGVEGLGPHQCRWPIGDPQSADFHFCHHKRIGGISYCEIHARRAHRPIEEQPREIRIAARAERVKEDA
jgi:GcrA cell cycle regulator